MLSVTEKKDLPWFDKAGGDNHLPGCTTFRSVLLNTTIWVLFLL